MPGFERNLDQQEDPSLRKQLEDAQAQLDEFEDIFGPNHSKTIKKKEQIAALQQELENSTVESGVEAQEEMFDAELSGEDEMSWNDAYGPELHDLAKARHELENIDTVVKVQKGTIAANSRLLSNPKFRDHAEHAINQAQSRIDTAQARRAGFAGEAERLSIFEELKQEPDEHEEFFALRQEAQEVEIALYDLKEELATERNGQKARLLQNSIKQKTALLKIVKDEYGALKDAAQG